MRVGKPPEEITFFSTAAVHERVRAFTSPSKVAAPKMAAPPRAKGSDKADLAELASKPRSGSWSYQGHVYSEVGHTKQAFLPPFACDEKRGFDFILLMQ